MKTEEKHAIMWFIIMIIVFAIKTLQSWCN